MQVVKFFNLNYLVHQTKMIFVNSEFSSKVNKVKLIFFCVKYQI